MSQKNDIRMTQISNIQDIKTIKNADMKVGIFDGTAYGNRTHDSAVRGLRLDLLTNAA